LGPAAKKLADGVSQFASFVFVAADLNLVSSFVQLCHKRPQTKRDDPDDEAAGFPPHDRNR